MNFLEKIFKRYREEEKLKLRGEFKTLIVKRTRLLVNYAHELQDILDDVDMSSQRIVSNVSLSLLIQRITKLDDEYAAEEYSLFLEYRKAIKKYMPVHLTGLLKNSRV